MFGVLKNKTLIKGGLFSLFSFINQGIGFVLLVLLAKFIKPNEYGLLNLFNIIVTFLGFFIALSTQGYISVSFFKKEYNEFRKDFTSILIISSIIYILFIITIPLFYELLYDISNLTYKELFLAVSISYIYLFINITLDFFRVNEKIIKYGLLSCSSALLNFIISIILIVIFDFGWQGRIWGQFISGIFLCLIVFFIIKRNNLLYISKNIIKNINDILKWGIPLIPHLASTWIAQGGDRYIINYYYSLADVGLFSFALNLSNIIVMIGIAFNQTNSVYIFKILSSNEKDKLIKLEKQTKNIFIIYILASIFIVLGGIVFVPLFMPLYSSSIIYFVLLSICGFLQCIYFLFSNYMFYYNKTKELMMITFICSLLHLSLSLLFTKYNLLYICFIYIIIRLIMIGIVIYKSSKLLHLIR